jgi:hypothetical protein
MESIPSESGNTSTPATSLRVSLVVKTLQIPDKCEMGSHQAENTRQALNPTEDHVTPAFVEFECLIVSVFMTKSCRSS